MKLIVNADDFGLCENSSKAIAECFRRGQISQTTIMVTEPYFEKAVDLAKQEGFFDRIGLHVNLVEGTPMTDGIRDFPQFCGKDGNFNCSFLYNKWTRLHLPKEACRAAEVEISAQMRRFLEAGFTMRHYDSHRHSCTTLSLVRSALRAARANGFLTTRVYINLSGNSTGGQLSFAKRCYCRLIESIIERAGIASSDYLGYSWDAAREADKLPDAASVEVLCHPYYRLPDMSLSLSGELMDWKTPWEKSVQNLLKAAPRSGWKTFADLV